MITLERRRDSPDTRIVRLRQYGDRLTLREIAEDLAPVAAPGHGQEVEEDTMSGYICVNGHRSAACIHVEGEPRMCIKPGCQAEANPDDDAGLAAALRQAYREGKEAKCPDPQVPPVICLCGSTRFTGNMLVKQWEFTKQGYIVLSWCALPEGYFAGDGTHGAEQEGIKEEMDELHKRKIDLADEVFVLNLDGYIGESTQSEIEYALAHGKPVRYMERRATEQGGAGEGKP